MTGIIDALRALPDFYAMSGASEAQIIQAEQALGVRFAADYREYLAAFGVVSASGHELTGICASKRLNVVDVTLAEKACTPRIPQNWYVLEQANIDGIVIWQNSSGEVYQTAPSTQTKKLGDSIIAYLRLI